MSAEPSSPSTAPRVSFVGSLLSLRVLFGVLLLGVLIVPGLLFMGGGPSEAAVNRFVCSTANEWRSKYGTSADLQVARIDVRFRNAADTFVEGDGVVVVPAGLDLPGAQEIVATAAFPAALRTITVDGIVNQVWEYAGRLRKEMHFVALTLVRRAPRRAVSVGSSGTADPLDATLRWEALRTAKELEEHDLEDCASFSTWAVETAGEASVAEQLLRIVQRANVGESTDSEANDICAAVRKNDFTVHRAHVAATMAAREVGIPSFAFTAADSKENYLVGGFVGQLGWVTADVEHPESGLFTGGPALLARAPIIGDFPATAHGFWQPEGAAYRASDDWMPVARLSSTTWAGDLDEEDEPTDTTEALTLPLTKVCP